MSEKNTTETKTEPSFWQKTKTSLTPSAGTKAWAMGTIGVMLTALGVGFGVTAGAHLADKAVGPKQPQV